MIWLLIVIHLNLSATPIQVQYGEVVSTFQSEKQCVEKQVEFLNKAKEENQLIPPYFNIGCVPLKRRIM